MSLLRTQDVALKIIHVISYWVLQSLNLDSKYSSQKRTRKQWQGAES